MKKVIPLIIVAIIIGLIGGIFLLLKKKEQTPPDATSPVTEVFPIERYTGSVPTVPEERQRVILKNDSTALIEANDFRQLPNVTSVGEGFFNLNGLDPNINLPYSILYSERDNSFSISLDAVPLAVVRERVSNDLLLILDITKEEACLLDIFVGVTYDVNESLSGTNLGLSFCPGSTPL